MSSKQKPEKAKIMLFALECYGEPGKEKAKVFSGLTNARGERETVKLSMKRCVRERVRIHEIDHYEINVLYNIPGDEMVALISDTKE